MAKTSFLKASGKSWLVRVVVWQGTVQQEYFASTCRGVVAIVRQCHQNTYPPAFFDRTGRELVIVNGMIGVYDGETFEVVSY